MLVYVVRKRLEDMVEGFYVGFLNDSKVFVFM